MIVLNLGLIAVVLLAHLWTPKYDDVNLYSGITEIPKFPPLVLLPLMNVASIIFLFDSARYKARQNRFILAAWQLAYAVALFWGQTVFMNSADNSPTPSWPAMTLILVLPALLVLLSAIAAFRKHVGWRAPKDAHVPRPETIAEVIRHESTRGPSNEFGPNPIAGFIKGIGALWRNWKPAAALVAVWIVLAMAQHYAYNYLVRPYGGDPARFLILFTVYGLLGVAINSALFVVATASARNKAINLSQAVRTGLIKLPLLLVTTILSSIIIVLGTLALVIPGVIATFRLAIVPSLVMSRDVGAWTAIRLSNRLMKKNAMQVVGPGVIAGTLILVAALAQLVLGGVGVVAATAVTALSSASIFVYLVRLSDQLYEMKVDGYTRLRVNAANIWLLVVGIMGSVLVPFGVLVWAMATNATATKTYDTPCYRLMAPKSFTITSSGVCDTVAFDSYDTYRFKPLSDQAGNIDKLTNNEVSKLFPAPRYSRSPGPAHDAVDGETSKSYTFWDNQVHSQVTAIFIHTRVGRKAGGLMVHNYVLIDEPTSEQMNSWPTISSLINPMSMSDMILWPPYGTNDFRVALNKATTAWNDGNFDLAATLATEAAQLADSNSAKAAAFALVGDANYQESNDIPAQSAYQEALSLDPTNSDALRGMSNVYYDGGGYSQAVDYASRAIAQDDTDAEAYNLRAIGYDALGKHSAALADINKALELDPGNPQYQQNLELILNPSLDRTAPIKTSQSI